MMPFLWASCLGPINRGAVFSERDKCQCRSLWESAYRFVCLTWKVVLEKANEKGRFRELACARVLSGQRHACSCGLVHSIILVFNLNLQIVGGFFGGVGFLFFFFFPWYSFIGSGISPSTLPPFSPYKPPN